jgi:hypothetical protein
MGYKMTAKEELVGLIEDILSTDLDFLFKLAPRELGILATSLKGFLDREGKYILADYRRKSDDF